ncbi:Uncharacterised protein [Streptococcus suis]|nr:Uncharacterised protein [Streptococcus suis]CYV20772.1 Uncharacterised protein [Streptococcus suis]CYV86470.1 Uncharacterised protein [Streptococcus suis]
MSLNISTCYPASWKQVACSKYWSFIGFQDLICCKSICLATMWIGDCYLTGICNIDTNLLASIVTCITIYHCDMWVGILNSLLDGILFSICQTTCIVNRNFGTFCWCYQAIHNCEGDVGEGNIFRRIP